MPKVLTDEQVRQYHDDGATAPVPAFSREQAAAFLSKLEAFEATHPDVFRPLTRTKPHIVLKWVNEIIHDAKILDAVEDLIGPDILLYNLTTWIKEPRDLSFVGWHQDSTYFPLDPPVHVTAWVSLTDSIEENGNVKIVAGSHKLGQLKHTTRAQTKSMLSVGQSIDREFDPNTVRNMSLQPGEMSLHHTRTVHFSEPNQSTRRRIGLGISYIPTSVRITGTVRHTAMLVRGKDNYGHFDLEPSPKSDLAPEALEVHKESVKRFRAAQAEAIQAHDRMFASQP